MRGERLLEGKALRERHQVQLAVRVHDPVPVEQDGRVVVHPHLLPFLDALELAVVVSHDDRAPAARRGTSRSSFTSPYVSVSGR